MDHIHRYTSDTESEPEPEPEPELELGQGIIPESLRTSQDFKEEIESGADSSGSNLESNYKTQSTLASLPLPPPLIIYLQQEHPKMNSRNAGLFIYISWSPLILTANKLEKLVSQVVKSIPRLDDNYRFSVPNKQTGVLIKHHITLLPNMSLGIDKKKVFLEMMGDKIKSVKIPDTLKMKRKDTKRNSPLMSPLSNIIGKIRPSVELEIGSHLVLEQSPQKDNLFLTLPILENSESYKYLSVLSNEIKEAANLCGASYLFPEEKNTPFHITIGLGKRYRQVLSDTDIEECKQQVALYKTGLADLKLHISQVSVAESTERTNDKFDLIN